MAEIDEAKRIIKILLEQFAYLDNNLGGLTTGGVSALEEGFDFLGWDDPHPMEEMRCEYPECEKRGTRGIYTNNEYKFLCGEHFIEQLKEA